jgi:peptidoglycan/LPS O-acetylase OafA/YrhL
LPPVNGAGFSAGAAVALAPAGNTANFRSDREAGLTALPGRIPALDGLRGIAILLVLMWHGPAGFTFQSKFLSAWKPALSLTWSGVDLFFVLSGFLIGGILLDARESPRYFQTFYIRRAYRILPLYAAVIAASLLWPIPFRLWKEGFGPVVSAPVPFGAFVIFGQNFWMAYFGTFGSAATAVTWSLAIEEQFYLTCPVLVRKFSRLALFLVLTGVVIGAPLLRLLLHFVLRYGNFSAYVLMPCRADALCLGVLIALVLRTPAAWNLILSNRRALWVATLVFFGCVSFLCYRHFSMFAGIMTTAGYSVLAFFYTCCLLIALTSQGLVQKVLCVSWLRKLGTIAYCTYLVHFPVIDVVRRLLVMRGLDYDALPTRLISFVCGAALSLIIAAISWRFFEKPLLDRGHRFQY